MAKTTVDIVNILKYFSMVNEDGTCALAFITIYADGSYLLSDYGNCDVLSSEDLSIDHIATDIHGLAYMSVTEIDTLGEAIASDKTEKRNKEYEDDLEPL